MATMSVSGIVSGMDWDSIIDELITNAAKPAQVQVNKKTNLTNKKSLFEEMKVTMNSLQSSLTPLKLPSTYKAKEIEIERIDSNGSYKGVLTATVNADAEVNVYDLKVNQLARAQTNRSKQITSSVSGVLNDNGVSSGGTMYINMAGQRVGIEIGSTDTLQSIKSRINNTLKTLDIPVELTASVVDNRLILRSDNTGLGSDTISETLTYGRNGYSNITSFNVTTQDAKSGDFVIRADGKQLTYGTDYDIVNGNEIRWNEYAKTDNVKLEDSVTATYTMGAGDSITKSGYTMGTDTVNVETELGFSPNYVDSLRIKTSNKTYFYGTDFTVNDSGNIEWLKYEDYTPSGGYTVKYTFDGSSDAYIINTSKQSGAGAQSITNNIGLVFSDLEEQLDLDSSNTYTGGSYTFISDDLGSKVFKLTTDADTSEEKTYTYGVDYHIRSGGGGVVSIVFDNEDLKAAATGFRLTYTPPEGKTVTASGTSSDTNALTLLNFPSSFQNSSTDDKKPNPDHITITDDTTGEELTNGTNFTIDSSGNITWVSGTTTTTTPPEEDAEFSLIYTSGDALTATYNNYNAASARNRIYLNDGSTTLTFDDLLSDAGISSISSKSSKSVLDSSGFSKWAEDNFQVFGSGNKRYTFGEDYYIAGNNSTDAVYVMWLDGKDHTDENLTIKYYDRTNNGGGEKLTIEDAVTRSNTDAIQTGTSGTAPLYSNFVGGTTTITQGAKTFYEGVDYEIGSTTTTIDSNGNTVTNATVEWKTGTNSEWYYPEPGANYTINLTTASGTSLSYAATRNSVDTLDLREYGFTDVNGSVTSISFKGENKIYTYDLTDTTTDDDGYTPAQNMARQLGLNVTDSTNGGFNTFSFNWTTPERTANTNLPSYGSEITAEYTYNANTFTLEDDKDGKLLAAFELNLTDSDHYMAAQDAILELDGEKVTRSSNDIGESYDNELIKGMTIHLKGTGEVSLDVSHDAQKAVESIQTFVDTYNDLMSWMNTRMTEKSVDEDTAATIDSDDFRMRWGLLHGNSLLRQTKSRMRSIVSQNFTFSFTQRTSAEEIYGTMAHNGLRNDATLRLRISNKFVDVAILPTDTLQDIIDKINDDSEDGPMRDIYYDDEGNKLAQPLLRASIENDRLVINSTSNDAITVSGTSAMNALKINYTYKGLYQLGISTTSTDYGKSGELEFDTSAFMEALEDNPDEVQELMLMFANEFDTWTKSMLNSSSSGETSGTLTRQIEDLENQISTIDEYLEKYQDRLDRMEESLKTKYANTETSLSKLTQQASSIAAILNQLNGYSSSSSSDS